jgi:hypothetical protein
MWNETPESMAAKLGNPLLQSLRSTEGVHEVAQLQHSRTLKFHIDAATPHPPATPR